METNSELESLAESLRHAIHYLNGILADIEAGTYTRSVAAIDLEALTGNEPLAFMSDLHQYAEGCTCHE